MRTRKLGIFYVSKEFFEDRAVGEGKNLFHDMVVLRAQENFEKDAIEYIAEHPDFAQVPLSNQIPVYTATFTSDSIYPTWAPR